MRLENKVCFVTGGGSGMGRVAAQRFCAEGARVAVVDLNQDQGEAAATEARAAGGDAFFVKCDVSKEKDVASAIQATAQRFGRIELWAGEIWAKRLYGRMKRDGAVLHELGDRRVEAHHDVFGYFEDDACPPGGHFPALAWRVAMPGAGHAQMGVQGQSVVEADDHVFSPRLDRGDVAANDALDCGTGRSRLRGQNLTTNQEWPQGSGGLKDRVAFRHSPRSAPLHGAGVPPEDGSRLASAASVRGTRV